MDSNTIKLYAGYVKIIKEKCSLLELFAEAEDVNKMKNANIEFALKKYDVSRNVSAMKMNLKIKLECISAKNCTK